MSCDDGASRRSLSHRRGILPALADLAFFRCLVRVHWADTDAAGVVWHGHFFRWFESAEEELYRALGRPRQALLEQLGIMMPRVDVRARFKSPARPDELLTIGVALSELSERRVGFAFDVREHESERFLAEGGYRLAVVARATFTPLPVPPALADLLRRAADVAAQQRALPQL
jgi:acyl-CoA thioester hydrolase